MTQDQANNVVEWFIGLCPSVTSEQCGALRNAIVSYAEPAVREACEHAATHHRFAHDAIVNVVESLEMRFGKPSVGLTTVAATQSAQQLQRLEAANALRKRRADDRAIREAPRDVLDRVAADVLKDLPAPEADMYRRRGLDRSKAWRGLVAKALREEAAHVVGT
jgi:hypothetical protein